MDDHAPGPLPPQPGPQAPGPVNIIHMNSFKVVQRLERERLAPGRNLTFATLQCLLILRVDVQAYRRLRGARDWT